MIFEHRFHTYIINNIMHVIIVNTDGNLWVNVHGAIITAEECEFLL